MFQPFNDSYIRSEVEATRDRYLNETEEERALREAKMHQPKRAAFSLPQLFHALGQALLNAGKRMNKVAHANNRARAAHTHKRLPQLSRH